MGNVYVDMEDYEHALFWHLKALKLKEEVLGIDHPSTAATYNNLGGIYFTKEDYQQSLNYYFKALKIMVRSLGLNHPQTVNVLHNMQKVFANNGGSQSEFMPWLNKMMK